MDSTIVKARVILRITSGPLAGHEYVYDSHDTFLFGRDAECRASVPGDPSVSRHHFALEIKPPEIRLQDLGSLNGTLVNGVRTRGCRARSARESERRNPTTSVKLKHGDVIAVGETQIRVGVVREMSCRLCGALVRVESDREASDLCETCQRGTQSTVVREPLPAVPRCVSCHGEVTLEAGYFASGDYVCQRCRRKLHRSPRDLRSLVQEQSHRSDAAGTPRQLAGYVLDKVLGKGGMGVVYRAYSTASDSQPVALKVILTDSTADEKVVKRVLREIGIGLDLNHKRIVRVMAHGSFGNIFYVAMELCAGGSLERLLKRHGGRIRLDKAVRMMDMCLEGLEYLHQRNLVHRDLKPANILLHKGSDRKLHPKISDFGLAKCLELAGLSGMTATGSFGGSWHYMPREQMTNFKFVGPVSDVWSLAATFYEVLTGRFAREFPPRRDPIQVVLQDDAVPIQTRDAGIPRPLAEIIDRALASDPEQRYADAGAMRRALAKIN